MRTIIATAITFILCGFMLSSNAQAVSTTGITKQQVEMQQAAHQRQTAAEKRAAPAPAKAVVTAPSAKVVAGPTSNPAAERKRSQTPAAKPETTGSGK